MSKQLLIYERVVPLSSEAHRDVSVKMSDSFDFARDLNSVPLLAAEFASAVPDHPIVFAGQGDAIFPAIILGLEQDANLCVDAEGGWTGGYIPAFLRRYPFVFSQEAGNFTLCIDEGFAGLNRDGRGERLFDVDGNRTSFLQNMLTFVSQYQAQFERTRLFCQRLASLDLLEPAQARFSTPAGRSGTLSGFMTINRDRLKAIPEASLHEMFATDELELCFIHLHSLQNINRLGNRVPAAEAVATAAE
ncbi:SapC protein [Cereibacter ovatus]|uniref:SapC protein n=1 Tax=Cereibacter ovatus TaxID=439529 RepID=A0A285D2D0_9RHOB|nr:SapC family protein [Cereibacter ovatus]SNX73970.1 SapC protein [Cereibacter ovatus]